MDKKITTTLFAVLSLLVIAVLIMQIQKIDTLDLSIRQLAQNIDNKKVVGEKDSESRKKEKDNKINIGIKVDPETVAKINGSKIKSVLLGFEFNVPEDWSEIKVKYGGYKEFFVSLPSGGTILGTTGHYLNLADGRGANWTAVSSKLNQKNKNNYCQVLKEDNTFRSKWMKECKTFTNKYNVQITQVTGDWEQLFGPSNTVKQASMYIIDHPHPVMKSIVLTDIYLLKKNRKTGEKIRNQVKNMVDTFKFTRDFK